jgi:muramidase (phage lysozyme)
LDYIAKNGGHASVLDKNGQIVPVHPGTRGNYAPVNPEFAARLAAAGQAYEKATGKAPQYGELARGNDVQQIYYDRYKSGQGGIAAPPGASQHQKGAAGDLPSGGFRDWLYAGNADKYGLHFPVRGDVPHVQMNPDFKGNLATASAAPASGDPRFPANTGPPKVGPEGVPIPPQAETANAAVPAGLDSGRMRQAFLNTILKGEAPKGSYGLVNGGGQITDFSKAPTGTAASGQYQFLPSTWAEQAKKYGYTDFKPETQDTAAWNYAKDIYKQKAGRDLGADLMSKDPQVLNGIGTALNKTWTSLPGGPEPNSNWKGQDFASAYSSNLGDGDIGGGGATPDAGTATASATPDASGASSSSGFNMKDFGSNLGSGLGDIGSIMAKGPVAQNAATKSGPANLPMTTLPPPVGPVPMVDPRVADAQRQQLAVALQRLNSRRLV